MTPGDVNRTTDNLFKTDFSFNTAVILCKLQDTGKKNTLEPWMMLLIAKKMITVLWRNLKPPTVQQWRERLESECLMESTTAKLQPRTDVLNIKYTGTNNTTTTTTESD